MQPSQNTALVMAPLYEATSLQEHSGMARVVTCTPTRLSANRMNHALVFPAEADPHFTNP